LTQSGTRCSSALDRWATLLRRPAGRHALSQGACPVALVGGSGGGELGGGRLDEAWEAHRSSGPLQKVIDAVGEDSVREVIDAALTADRKPGGKYRQDNVMRYVLAARP
jgi:hypothetical protein